MSCMGMGNEQGARRLFVVTLRGGMFVCVGTTKLDMPLVLKLHHCASLTSATMCNSVLVCSVPYSLSEHCIRYNQEQ
jgi:fructose/tagatose bisphosphate aldolase